MAKNLKGGYQIISLLMVNLLAVGGNTISGIYNKIEGSYKKPILLEGINIGGAEKHAIYVIPELSGDDYVLKGVYGYDITIDDDDKVTVQASPVYEAITKLSLEESYDIQDEDITDIVADTLYTIEIPATRLTLLSQFKKVTHIYSDSLDSYIAVGYVLNENGIVTSINYISSQAQETIKSVIGVKA